MNYKIIGQPLQFLSNKEVIEVIRMAIDEERNDKKLKHVHKTQRVITEDIFFKSKLFNKKW